MLTISPTNFKADVTPRNSTFSNVNHQRPYIPYEEDSLDLMTINRDLEKKQKRKERLETWTTIGTCTLGFTMLGILALQLYSMFKGAKGDKVKVVWEDMAKKDNFPKLDDPCVNEKVRNFITNIKETAGLSSDVMKRAGVESPEQCMIIWGPSGTGKTFSAKLMAKELGAEYSEVQFADVSSPFIGQTSVEIKGVFKRLADKAKKNPDKKYLVAFNEIDALLVPREKCGSNNLHLAENRTAFLNGLDQIKELKNVKIVGTTNVNPDSGNLDKASLSRFGNILKIDLPDKNEIIASLKFHLSKSEDVKNGKFFENNKAAIEKFAQELHKKRYAHRDVEDIAAKARRSYAIDIQADSKKEFKLDYLEKAVKTKGKPVGAIGDETSFLDRLNIDIPEFDAPQPKKSFLSKLFGRKQK